MKLHTVMFSWFTGIFLVTMLVLYSVVALIISEEFLEQVEPILREELSFINKIQLSAVKAITSDTAELELLLKKFENAPHGDFSYNNEHFIYSYMQLPSSEKVYLSLITADRLPTTYINHSINHIRNIRQAILNSIILVNIVLFVIILWIFRSISRKISRPVSTITHSLENVAHGDYSELLDFPSSNIKEIASLRDSFYTMVSSLKEKERVRSILDKVVSPKIAQEITKGNIRLGGEVRNITLLFTDIRGFTKMTEFMPPEETILMLNRLMTRISQIIQKHDGVIDKYVGDMVMALFGAPVPDPDNIIKCVHCAWDIIADLDIWNQERKKLGKLPIHMGIGIHHGPMLVGNMGAEDRLNYTVVGANVNLASRLCGIAKAQEIAISNEIANDASVKQHYLLQEQASTQFKGFSESFTYFTVSNRTRVT